MMMDGIAQNLRPMNDPEVEKLACDFGYHGMFNTPKTPKDFVAIRDNMIEGFHGAERVAAMTLAGQIQNYYAMNLARVLISMREK